MSLNQQQNLDWFDGLDYHEILIGLDRQYHLDSQLDFDTHLDSPIENFDLNKGDFSNQQQASIPAEPLVERQNDLDLLRIQNKTAMEQDNQSNQNQKMMEEETPDSDSNSEEKNLSNGRTNKVEKQSNLKKQYRHLKRERRPKGKKNHLQANVKGYWTKNFLQSAKKPHLDYIEKFFPGMVEKNQHLKEINQKNGITMNDFVIFYTIPQLDQMWKIFFTNRVLYRDLMLSRTSSQYRLIYIQFLHVFEKAFIEKKFDCITPIEKTKPTNYGHNHP